MKAMLFAAGLGTRLSPLTEHKPKALIEVAGKTLLQRNVDLLASQGVNQIIINVHHFSNHVIDFVKKLQTPQLSIHISDETDRLLDTGGGLKKASPFFDDGQPFVIMNTDVVTNFNLYSMVELHHESEAMATLAVRNRDSGRNFLFNNQQLLCGWQDVKKGTQRLVRDDIPLVPLAFSGIQVISPAIFSYFPKEDIFSLVDLYLEAARHERIVAYIHDADFWFDAGSIEKIAVIEKFFASKSSAK